MKLSILASALLTTLVAAAPAADIDERQTASARVQLTDTGSESARQFDIPINGRITPILSGNGFVANQISIVGTGNVQCLAYLATNGQPVGKAARGPNGSQSLGGSKRVRGVKCSRP